MSQKPRGGLTSIYSSENNLAEPALEDLIELNCSLFKPDDQLERNNCSATILVITPTQFQEVHKRSENQI